MCDYYPRAQTLSHLHIHRQLHHLNHPSVFPWYSSGEAEVERLCVKVHHFLSQPNERDAWGDGFRSLCTLLLLSTPSKWNKLLIFKKFRAVLNVVISQSDAWLMTHLSVARLKCWWHTLVPLQRDHLLCTVGHSQLLTKKAGVSGVLLWRVLTEKRNHSQWFLVKKKKSNYISKEFCWRSRTWCSFYFTSQGSNV